MTGIELAILGSLLGAGGAAGSYFGSRGDKSGGKGSVQKVDLFTPQQKELMNQIGPMGLSGIRGLLDRSFEQLPQAPAPLDLSNLVSQHRFDFEPIAQQARSQFFGSTVPTIAERFNAMGGGQSRPGTASGLIGQLGSAGAGLEQGLAALQSKYGLLQQQNLFDQAARQAQLGLQQQQNQFNMQSAQPQFQAQQQASRLGGYQNLLGGGLGQQFQPLYTPPSPGFLTSMAPGIGQGIGNLGSMYGMSKLGLL